MSRGVCEFCDEPVLDLHAAAFRIRGWEFEGTANAVHGKERQKGRIAHAACVKRVLGAEKRGLAGQTSLL